MFCSIHPVVIVEVGRNVRALQLRTVGLIQRPAFLALAAVGLLRTGQVLALAHVEAGQMAAGGQRRPDDAVAVDVDTARIEAGAGTLKIWVLQLSGGLLPRCSRTSMPGIRFSLTPQTESSTGLGITEYRL